MYSKRISSILRTVASRMALLHAALFTVLSVLVFGLLYVMMVSRLNQRTDTDLLDNAREFESLYAAHGVQALSGEFQREAEARGKRRVFFRLVDPRMNVLASSDLTAWNGLPPLQVQTAPSEWPAEVFETLELAGQRHRVRAVAMTMTDGNILQVGYTLEENERMMERYRGVFGTALAVMLVCASGVGWLVTRRAMAGVERATRTAIHIRKGDLASRVPVGSEGKEIEDLANAFNEMLERIQALVAEMKEVTDNIAHDLRSPITRIRGVAETAVTGEESLDAYREMAGVVIEESDRLVGMINTMLEIAETDAGVAELATGPVDLAETARNAHGLFLPVAEDKGVSLRLDLPAQCPVVHGDGPKLQRVLANLLDNAIKFTLVGGEVRLRVETTNAHAVITVADSGVGIGEKDLPHIFERFYRAERSRSTPGNGLGLSLAQAIVVAHRGNIDVESQPGKGSTFTVRLPLVSPPERRPNLAKR